MRSSDENLAPDRSYLRILAQPILLLLSLVAIGIYGFVRSSPKPAPPAAISIPSPIMAAPAPKPEPVMPAPSPIPAPTLDVAAVARAEEALRIARIERARAEGRVAGAGDRLEKAQVDAAAAAAEARSFASRVKNPGVRVASVRARLDAVLAEKKKLEKDVAAIEGAPRPARKKLVDTDKNPVARPAEGKEFHFEVRKDRVAFIDLDRLTEKVKADVRLQAHALLTGKPVGGLVGPVGEFSMRYEVGAEMPDSVDRLLESRGGMSYQLRGWELVPDRERRGETYESTRHPASEFARAVHRLSPTRATITMWVYPGGFALYRRLRDELHAQGFLVAARPLPDGVAIQGSPGGSKSAGQ